jgi:TPR repeat protein
VTDGLPPIAVDLIGKCCNARPTNRPTIEEIISIIEKNPTKLGFSGVDQNAFKSYVDRIARSLPRVNKPVNDAGGGGVISAGPISKAEYLERLVRAGSASAAFFLGVLFESGDGVEKDIGKALSLYRQSGEGGCPFGNLRAGLILRESDPILASKYFESAGLAGNSDGLNELGQLTESGTVKGGVEAAVKLYGKAALLGSEGGRRNYARCLAQGIGVPANPRLAARFQGDVKGKAGAPKEEDTVARGLGLVAEGEFEKAAAEFRTAAAAGSGDALFSLGWLVEQGRIAGNAEEFYRDAVNRGSVRAHNNLGVLLVRSGQKEEGFELISQAARQGDAYGMNNIAVGIENGDYPGDIQVVAGLYRGAAMRGVIEGLENYAAVVGAGIGIERNDAEAQYYLEKAKQKRAAS